MTALRFRGAVSRLSPADANALFNRSMQTDAAVSSTVSAIIADVRARGDEALRDLAARFDPAVPEALEVPRAEWKRALDALDADVRRAMARSADNIARVHRTALPMAVECSPEPGIIVVRRPDPLARVGVYAPGGRAAYPSSVLMGAVPARVAGVSEVALCSPPTASGRPSDIVLAAAELSEVDRVFAVGGAGAIAALALGTATIPRVDRIVGPGNAYVAEAKLQLVGSVAIDSPAGPSELLVIADDAASAATVAREMLAQAEHDPLACVVCVAVGERAAQNIEAALQQLVCAQPRADIVRRALAGQGGVVWVDDVESAIAFCNSYAPEHALIACGDADVIAASLRGAGTVFVGETSSVAFGDYMTGANHVLPTGGSARAYSGLSTLDFFRWTTCQRVDRAAARALAVDTAVFADAEGLPGHSSAARQWSDS